MKTLSLGLLSCAHCLRSFAQFSIDWCQTSGGGGSGNDVGRSHLTTPPPPTFANERAPPISIRRLWPTNDPPFSLQTATTLTAASWRNALHLPVGVAASNIVNNSGTAAHRFYRLSNPGDSIHQSTPFQI